jgi:hypothetical protein
VRLADDDQPGGGQTPCERGGYARPPVAPDGRAACRHSPFDLDQVLESDRNPVQRHDRMPGANRLVGRLGGKQRLFAIHFDKGMEFPVVRPDSVSSASTRSTGESRRSPISDDRIWTGNRARSVLDNGMIGAPR